MAPHRDFDQGGDLKLFSDKPPAHFTLKVESFSLMRNTVDWVESGVFETGGHKWNLVLCPDGNKKKNVQDHISLYLKLDERRMEKKASASVWRLLCHFRLFLLDQKKGIYLVMQDGRYKTPLWCMLNNGIGFDEFIPHKEFTDASNGYLIDDTCVFGAEVFLCKKTTAKEECISMLKHAVTCIHVWKVQNFSKLELWCYESEPFIVGYQKCIWNIRLYPKGYGEAGGTYLSLFLELANPSSLPSGSKVFVDYTIRIVDQIHAKHKFHSRAGGVFTASSLSDGWEKFITLHDLFTNADTGFLMNDACIVEAEVSVHGIVNAPE